MADVTVKRLDEFETSFGGAIKLVRHGLGVGSFGISIIDIPPAWLMYLIRPSA